LARVVDLVGDRLPDRLAAIHGTVDLERALGERGRPPADALRAIGDELLGARVVLIEAPSGRIALAEPTTEGRLAAALARHGEGLVGDYLGLPWLGDADAIREHAGAAGVAVSRPADGPFGRGVAVLGGRIGDPIVVLVGREPVPSPR
jgi:hypothetical protein